MNHDERASRDVTSATPPAQTNGCASDLTRARLFPRVSYLAAEARLIEGLTAVTGFLAAVAIVLPIWLIFGSPASQGESVNRFLMACQVGVHRGALGLPGFGAAIFLLVWGTLWLARVLPTVGRSTVALARARARVDRQCQPAEVFFRGQPVAFRLLQRVEPIAFTAGLWRPRIYLSTAVFSELSRDEQDAVLAHELAHVRSRDPLRCLAVRVVLQALPLPGASRWAARYRSLKEVAADLSAVGPTGDSRPLLRALAKVSPVSPPGVCGLNQATLAGILLIRDSAQGISRRDISMTLAAVVGLGLLAVIALIGLTDWHSYLFCPQMGFSEVASHP